MRRLWIPFYEAVLISFIENPNKLAARMTAAEHGIILLIWNQFNLEPLFNPFLVYVPTELTKDFISGGIRW